MLSKYEAHYDSRVIYIIIVDLQVSVTKSLWSLFLCCQNMKHTMTVGYLHRCLHCVF